MKGEEARLRLKEIFGLQIGFNKDFDKHIELLKESMALDFLDWCKGAKDNKELGSVPRKKEFKHLYVFFRKIASDVRAVLIKEQSSNFFLVILSDHKQYDDERTRLGYKRSSYYDS